jgi:hypothetical protein
MSEQTITTSQEEKSAARREAKAAAERKRAANIKVINAACEAADFGDSGAFTYRELTPEQRERALAYQEHPGISKVALGEFILTGKTLHAQQDEAHQAAKAKDKADKKQRAADARAARPPSPRVHGDPAAKALADAATALITDEETGKRILKTAILPRDAREFINTIKVEKPSGTDIIVVRRADGVTAEFVRQELERHVIGREKNPEVRVKLSLFSDGQRLWGSKLGLFILAS